MRDNHLDERGGTKLAVESGLRYRIDDGLRLVEIVGHQAPGLGEVIGVFDAFLGDPSFRPGFGILQDCRGLGVSALELIRGAMGPLSQKEGLGWSRWAVVVDPPETAGTFQLTVAPGGAPFMALTFHDIDAARLWLSLRRGADGRSSL